MTDLQETSGTGGKEEEKRGEEKRKQRARSGRHSGRWAFEAVPCSDTSITTDAVNRVNTVNRI
ncbi:hypothetical protein ACFWNG_20595 [Streptomyces sp. NPDC058391]|uniref:hypothetical protein n=1 Tax=Streptomyces sp. NPDC058391 TaxID=3346476 RepID=UPI00365179ED